MDIVGEIVLLIPAFLETPSVISFDFWAVSNTVLSNRLLSNSLPKSNNRRIDVGEIVESNSPDVNDSVNVRSELYALDTTSDILIVLEIVLKPDNILVNVWPILVDSDTLLCDARFLTEESVESSIPPLLISNTALSNMASSNNCLVSDIVTK